MVQHRSQAQAGRDVILGRTRCDLGMPEQRNIFGVRDGPAAGLCAKVCTPGSRHHGSRLKPRCCAHTSGVMRELNRGAFTSAGGCGARGSVRSEALLKPWLSWWRDAVADSLAQVLAAQGVRAGGGEGSEVCIECSSIPGVSADDAIDYPLVGLVAEERRPAGVVGRGHLLPTVNIVRACLWIRVGFP